MGPEQYIDCVIRYNGRLAIVTGSRSNYDGDWINMRYLDGKRPFSVNAFERECLKALPDPSSGLLKRRDQSVIFEYNGIGYELTSHPFEPCLYIKRNGVIFRTLHNAFTADELPERFAEGETLTGIDGKPVDLTLFCKILAATIDGDRSEMDFPFAARLVK